MESPVHRATLVTVRAACDALQHFGSPAATVAAVRGLQGAQPMMPAEISSLSPLIGFHSAQEDDNNMSDSGHDAPAAAQQTGQVPCVLAQPSRRMLQRESAPAAGCAEVKRAQQHPAASQSSNGLPEGSLPIRHCTSHVKSEATCCRAAGQCVMQSMTCKDPLLVPCNCLVIFWHRSCKASVTLS